MFTAIIVLALAPLTVAIHRALDTRSAFSGVRL